MPTARTHNMLHWAGLSSLGVVIAGLYLWAVLYGLSLVMAR